MYLLKQDTDECKSTLGESSSGDNIFPAEGQGNTNGDELSSSDCLNRKGKIPGSVVVEPSGQEKLCLKTNGMSNDIVTPALEKDRQAKIKASTIRSRQTQSGPLVPNAVLGHSPPERWCTSDRLGVEFSHDLFC